MASVIAASVLRKSLQSAPRAINRAAFAPSCRVQRLSRPFSQSATSWVKKYTEDHEWIELSEDGKTGTIGVSAYAAKALGDVVFVELPTTDIEVTQGDSIGAVESVKSASDIMTPISGTIIEANSLLEDKPATINKSPEADGWLAKIQVKDQSELEGLMDADAYKSFTEESSD